MHSRTNVIRKRLARVVKRMVSSHCDATSDLQLDIADELEFSAGHLSNVLNGHDPLSVETLIRLTRLLGDREAVQELCRMCNVVAVVPPETIPDAGALAALVEEVADVLRAHAQAIAPDSENGEHYVPAEAEALERVAWRLIEGLLAFVQRAKKDAIESARTGDRVRKLRQTA